MSITFVDAGTPAWGSTIGTTGLTVDLPTHVEDDLLIMYSDWGDDNGGTFSVPSGWTEIGPFTNVENVATDVTQRTLYKVAGASEPATVSLTNTYAGTEYWGAVIVAFRGVHADIFDVAAHLDQYDYRNQNAGVNVQPIMDVTTITDGAWVLAFEKVMGSDLTGAITLTDYTKRVDTVGNFNAQQMLFTREVASAGAQTPGTISFSRGSTRTSQTSTMVLKPASFTPPLAAPTSLTATADGNTIDLAWTESADVGLESTKLYRSITATVVVHPDQLIATVTAGTEVYADTGLDYDEEYFYVATSYDDPDESVKGNEDSATTGAAPSGGLPNEPGDTLLKELQVAGATSKEVVGALNELNATWGVEFDLAYRTYRGI